MNADNLVRLRRVGEHAISPDGTWLAVAVQRLDEENGSYTSELWKVPTTGGAAIQLTRGKAKDRLPRFRRDGALAFLSNREGKGEGPERSQVWILPATGGEPTPLTDEPLGVADFAFAKAGNVLMVLAEVYPGVPDAEQRAHDNRLAKQGPTIHHFKSQPSRHWDSWLPATGLHAIAYDEHGKNRRDLTPTARHQLRNLPWEGGFDVSTDGRLLAMTWAEMGGDRNFDSWLRVVEIASGASRDLGREPGISFVLPRFAPDSRRIAAVKVRRGNGVGEVNRLWCFDQEGQGRAVADWDAQPHLWDWTSDGKALLATADIDGQTPLWSVDVASGSVTRVTGDGFVENVRPMPQAGRAVAVCHRYHTPPELHAFDLTTGAATPLATLSGFDAAAWPKVAVESLWAESKDGARVQYFVVRPTAIAKPPVLLWIHGGPVGQHADQWHWRWNALTAAGLGYAVVLPNPRGSTGRDQKFIDGVYDNTWGGACYDDLMAVADQVARRPDVDGTKMIAMGGSFGGYMVNWIGTQTDRFRALISHAGIYSFTAFHGCTDHSAYFSLEMGLSPYQGDQARWQRYSPDAFVANWKTPVLITHGEKDYRVAIADALMLFEAVQAKGVESELVIFPDENHWVLRPNNIKAWYQAWHEFAQRHLQ